MDVTSSGTASDRASHACEVCKKRKVKCDKALPTCSLCARKNMKCEYAQSDGLLPLDVFSSFPRPTKSLADHRQRHASAVYFLDYEIFTRGQMDVPIPSTGIPPRIMNQLGGAADARKISSNYFQTVHTWLPIVSKQRLYDQLLNPLFDLRADVALLCLCMKLVTWQMQDQDEDPETLLYSTAKQYLIDLEVSGVFTLQTLQSCIFIAIYELGHAIYPSAYMSIGMCARYATALGISWKTYNSQVANSAAWIDQEEQIRVFWAIIILDRLINVGCPDRPLMTEDPSIDALLPTDDTEWDQGVMIDRGPITLSSPSTIMGRFARVALATHLLGRVLRHRRDNSVGASFKREEAQQLDRALHALLQFNEHYRESNRTIACCQTAVCYSALLTLYVPELFASMRTFGNENDHHMRAVVGLGSEAMLTISERYLRDGDESTEEISPFVIHCIYQTAFLYVQRMRAAQDEGLSKPLNILKETLRRLTWRWKSAGVYLQLLEAREVMNIS